MTVVNFVFCVDCLASVEKSIIKILISTGNKPTLFNLKYTYTAPRIVKKNSFYGRYAYQNYVKHTIQ